MPRVLNNRTDHIPHDAVYVGRPSKWGNPFLIGRDGAREQVVKRHREWVYFTCDLDGLKRELRGKDLVCWCAPLPCHADVLLELANWTWTEEAS